MSCCSLGAARFAIMGCRHGNADLRRHSPPQAGGRDGPRPPGWPASRRGPPAAQVARRHGNADLRSAQPAAGGRTGRTPPPRMASLSAWTPGAQVARRQGNADLRSAQPAVGGRMRRTPPPRMAFLSAWTPAAQVARTGTPTSGRHSPPQAGGGTDPDPPDGLPLGVDPSSAGGAQARERRPPASSPGGGRHSPPQAGGREGPRPPGWLSCRRGPQQRRWRAGKGTPTSGRQARRRRAAGRTPTPRMASLSAWTPAAQVARRQGNADLWASSPGGGRHSPPQAGGGKDPDPPDGLPSRRGPQQRRWRAGTGTPTSGQFSRWGPAQPAAGGRMGRTPISRLAPLSAWTAAAQVARRHGNADLRRHGGAASAADGVDAEWRRGAHRGHGSLRRSGVPPGHVP